MTTFLNQDRGAHGRDHDYIKVWFDETAVRAFDFHSVMHDDARLFGVQVEARHVWAATHAFHCITNIMAIAPDGTKFFVTWVGDARDGTEEFRAGHKYGKVIARMSRTGYIQEADRAAHEEAA